MTRLSFATPLANCSLALHEVARMSRKLTLTSLRIGSSWTCVLAPLGFSEFSSSHDAGYWGVGWLSPLSANLLTMSTSLGEIPHSASQKDKLVELGKVATGATFLSIAEVFWFV